METTQTEDIITIEAQPMESWKTNKVNEYTIEVVLSTSSNTMNLKNIIAK